MEKYKSFKELKEELGDKFEEYMYQANLELLQIIDKAIEYIKEDMYVEPKELYGLIDGEHLLNILKGEDKE